MTPYISFVVGARNDDYGGNFLHRMQVFVNVLLSLWDKYSLDAELIIVEWNPPEDKPRLRDVLVWPERLKSGTVRIIEVPNEIHKRLPNSDRMPMFEYLAKNVGIRRARGEYVLATNPDIIFGEQLMGYVATRGLSSGCFYRVDRYDVAREVPLDLPVERQIQFCVKHAFRVHKMRGSVPTSRLARLRLFFSRHLPRLSPDRFVHGLVRRWRMFIDYSCQSARDGRTDLPLMHTNAAGDFLLIAKQQWRTLRGFPELTTHSHTDSYMVLIATLANIKQVVLPYRIYHQEHDRSEQTQRPLTNLAEMPVVRMMLETRELRVQNDKNWGLGHLRLTTVDV